MNQNHSLEMNPAEVITHGSPVFSSPQWSELAKREGAQAAWRACIAAHGADAPKHVDGNFAVGVIEASGEGWLAVDRCAFH